MVPAGFVALLLALSALPHPTNPREAVIESGCPEDRLGDYVLRHSDRGIIDPVVMLELSRDVQRTIDSQRRDRTASAIAGGVWTSIGPANGAGRATAIAIDRTAPGTLIIGAAGGGAWKSSTGGASWTPLTESVPNLSVGALALAPSSPSTIYLGSGEGGYAGDFIPGIGLLMSADGGANWTLPSTVIATGFYKMSVHPTKPNELVVATNQGALRSTAGQNGPWSTVIPRASSATTTGYGDVTDLVRDPSNPLVLYAATWDRDAWCARYPCSATSNYASSTVLKSTDGGATWSAANAGLPLSTSSAHVDRLALAIAPSSPSTLYLSTTLTDDNSDSVSHIYKTTNGGAAWTETSLSSSSQYSIQHYHGTQAWYDNTIAVSPTDPNTVIAGGVTYVRTRDGGLTWTRGFPSSYIHVDVHELTFDAAGTLWIANDGGVWSSGDNGVTPVDHNTGLVTRQYYTLAADEANRSRMFGGTQDNGTSRRGDAGGMTWDDIVGGDGFGCAIVPSAPSVLVASYQHDALLRTNGSADSEPNFYDVSPWFDSDDPTPFATVISSDPTRPEVIYTGTTRLWRSSDAGESWVPLPSTTTDSSTFDLTAGHEIRAIAIAKTDPRILMVAKGYDEAAKTYRAAIFRSTDGGNTWSMRNTGLPIRYPTSVEIDPADSNVAYVTFAGVTGTPVYKTIDGGSSWTASGSGLPPFSAQVVRVEPSDSNTVYCGTDVGVYRSTDAGATWSRFGTGMPAVSVYEIRPGSDGSSLRAATHGRGVWELTVNGVTNHPPSASISSPGGTMSVARGVPVNFAGAVGDPDAGDSATAKWTFPDTWETATAATVSHSFARAGIFPVSLLATDTHGAIAAAVTSVRVLEQGDACASAAAIPAAGPFPWSVALNTQTATTEATDPGVGAPVASCFPYQPYTTLWLSFTPATSGTYDFYSCGSKVAAVIEVWSGNGCGPYTAVDSGCLTNFSTQTDCSSDERVSVALTAGTTYRIMVSGYYDQGPLTLTVAQGTISTHVSAIAPASGPAAGGTPVVISGAGFTAPVNVTIGGVAATNVNVLSPSLISAVSGAHAGGTTDVAVTSGAQTATLGGGFTYNAGATSCVPAGNQLCFVNGRYAVTLTAADSGRTGKTGPGEANVETADTGYFTLSQLTGSTQNPEVVVKVLQVGAIPWVFFGGLTDLEIFINVLDTQTGQLRQYHKVAGSVQNGFDTGGGQSPAPETTPGATCPLVPASVTMTATAPSSCVPNTTTLCLLQNRFKVELTAKDAGRTNNSGAGQARPKNDLFGFFSVPALTGNPNNQELFVKILDARALGGKFWLFFGTLSDFEFTLKVTDTQTGQVKTYLRPGQTACGAADTSAF